MARKIERHNAPNIRSICISLKSTPLLSTFIIRHSTAFLVSILVKLHTCSITQCSILCSPSEVMVPDVFNNKHFCFKPFIGILMPIIIMFCVCFKLNSAWLAGQPRTPILTVYHLRHMYILVSNVVLLKLNLLM